MDGDEASARDAGEFPRMYDQLRALAARYLRHERPDHTLQPTAIVHEFWLEYRRSPEAPSEDVPGFLAYASAAIRNMLVDHARTKRREKRGDGWSRVTLQEGLVTEEVDHVDLLDLDEAMDRLRERDRRLHRVVELRFFCGLYHREVAEELGSSTDAVENDWRLAKAWLRRELSRGGAAD